MNLPDGERVLHNSRCFNIINFKKSRFFTLSQGTNELRYRNNVTGIDENKDSVEYSKIDLRDKAIHTNIYIGKMRDFDNKITKLSPTSTGALLLLILANRSTAANSTNNTNTTGNSSSTDYPSIPLGREIGISTAVFAAMGIVINALVITVICLARTKQFSTYKHLMLHLAVVDFFCSVALVPYVPLELDDHHWTYPDAPCQIIYPVISLLTNISTGTVLTITIERFRGVWFPHARPWSGRDVQKAFAAMWTISVASILPNMITLKVTQYPNIAYCNEVWDNITHKRLYGFTFAAVSFLIPLLCITVMHTLIIIRLKFKSIMPDNMSVSQQRQNRRIMRVLTGIVVVFFFTVSPNKILYFVWDVSPELERSLTSKARLYMRTFQFFYYSRVAINPLIYCFFDTRFKNDLKKTKKKLRGQSIAESTMSGRVRSRSQRTDTIMSVRSRANSSFICEAEEVISRNAGNRMSKISEIDNTSFDTLNGKEHSHHNNHHGRERSATVDTQLSNQVGSVSPSVNSSLALSIEQTTTSKKD